MVQQLQGLPRRRPAAAIPSTVAISSTYEPPLSVRGTQTLSRQLSLLSRVLLRPRYRDRATLSDPCLRTLMTQGCPVYGRDG